MISIIVTTEEAGETKWEKSEMMKFHGNRRHTLNLLFNGNLQHTAELGQNFTLQILILEFGKDQTNHDLCWVLLCPYRVIAL